MARRHSPNNEDGSVLDGARSESIDGDRADGDPSQPDGTTFASSPGPTPSRSAVSRRDVLRTAAGVLAAAWLPADDRRRGRTPRRAHAQPNPPLIPRVYLAPDNHTDYMGRGDEEAMRRVFVETLDWVLDRIDETDEAPPDLQMRWTCDGSRWLWEYERARPPEDFERLMDRVADGHVSVAMTPLVCCYGGAPLEAVLRGMAYAGRIERRFGVRFRMACAMESHTLPLGLASLFAGSGARYSWKGICDCDTKVASPGDRLYDIHWWTGLDGRRVLLKWNSLLQGSRSVGGYAEARRPAEAVRIVTTDARRSGFAARYPYGVIGVFGEGWDDLDFRSDALVRAAADTSDDQRRVRVSNELDFFEDFEATYGRGLPRWGEALGNDWDVLVASMAETTGRIRRGTERLRSAEALASWAMLLDPDFMDGREQARDRAFMALGCYFEHNWKSNGVVPADDRATWQRAQADEVDGYVEELERDAAGLLARAVPSGDGDRVLAFNPLGWRRDGAIDVSGADVARALGRDPATVGDDHVHVVDASSGDTLPSQWERRPGGMTLRCLVRAVPAMGYRAIRVVTGPAPGGTPTAVGVVTDRTVVTDHFQAELTGDGTITRLLDRSAGNADLVRAIDGRGWNALAPGPVAGPAAIEVESIGPVALTLRAYGEEPLRRETRLTFYRHTPRIDLENRITEGFSSTYTWEFGFELDDFTVWHEEVGAILKARLSTDGGHYSPRNARYDWLGLGHFAAIGSADRWLLLSNADCCFFRLGRSTPERLDQSRPQLSVLAGGQVDGPALGIPDQGGDTNFLQRFAVMAENRFDPVRAMRFALEHQNPLMAIPARGSRGPLPADRSALIELDDPAVIPWSLKPADDPAPGRMVLRAWNLAGRSAQPEIRVRPPWTIRAARRVTHVETPLEPMEVADGRVVAALRPQALETWELTVDRVDWRSGHAAFLPHVGSPRQGGGG